MANMSVIPPNPAEASRAFTGSSASKSRFRSDAKVDAAKENGQQQKGNRKIDRAASATGHKVRRGERGLNTNLVRICVSVYADCAGYGRLAISKHRAVIAAPWLWI